MLQAVTQVIGAHRGAVGESSDVGVTKFTATPYADIGGQAPVSGMPGTDVPDDDKYFDLACDGDIGWV